LNRDTVAFRSSISLKDASSAAKTKISTLGRKGTSVLWPLRGLGAGGRVLGCTTRKRRMGMEHPSIYHPAYGQKKKLEQGRAVIPSRCNLLAICCYPSEVSIMGGAGCGSARGEGGYAVGTRRSAHHRDRGPGIAVAEFAASPERFPVSQSATDYANR